MEPTKEPGQPEAKEELREIPRVMAELGDSTSLLNLKMRILGERLRTVLRPAQPTQPGPLPMAMPQQAATDCGATIQDIAFSLNGLANTVQDWLIRLEL